MSNLLPSRRARPTLAPSLSRNLGALVVAAVCGLAGCVGYRLGSMLPPDIRTVYVPTFVNRTSEPLIEAEATRAALQQLQADGTLRVVGRPEDADAILEVELQDYTLHALSFDRENRDRANEYRATITASVTLRRTGTGATVVPAQQVKGETTFPFVSDLGLAKERALPDVARDLAHNIVERIVEAW